MFPVTLPSVSPARFGNITNGVLVTLPIVSGSVTKNSLSLHVWHFYLGGPICCVAKGSWFAPLPFSVQLGCFGFPWYPFGVSAVLFGALFSLCGCPFESFALLLGYFRVPLGPVLFFLQCVSNRIRL